MRTDEKVPCQIEQRSLGRCLVSTVYATPAGVADHWEKGMAWEGFASLQAWAPKCKVTALHGSEVVQSLW